MKGIPNDFSENLGKGISGFEAAEVPKLKEEIKLENVLEPPKVEPPLVVETPKAVITKGIETPKIETPVIKEEILKDVKEPNEEEILKYLNKDRQEDQKFKTIKDVYKTKEVEKEVEKIVDPWANILDEDDKAYLNFKKDTGNSRKEFDFITRDLSKISPLNLAIERVKNQAGIELSTSEAKEYLEQKLNIDFKEGLSKNDEIDIAGYANEYKQSLESQKGKYLTPVEKKEEKTKEIPQNDQEIINLEDGRMMLKSEYVKLLDVRKDYIKNITDAVNSVADSNFNIEMDINGEKKSLDFSYEYSKEDKHSMLSDSIDIDAMVNKRYKTENGLNHKALSKGLWWGVKANQIKVMTALAEKVKAETIEEMLASGNNENFKRQQLPKKETTDDGYGSLVGKSDKRGFGVQFDFTKQSQ